MKPAQQIGVGSYIGLHVGLRLWDEVTSLLPSAGDMGSASFGRELLGVLSLAENAAASLVLCLYPHVWSPAFRNDLASYIRKCAFNSGATICLFDLLRLPIEREIFCKQWMSRIELEGGVEGFFMKPRDYPEAFHLVQGVRSLEFAALCDCSPSTNVVGPEWSRKMSVGIVNGALFWIVGTSDRDARNLMLVEPSLNAVISLTRRICVHYLGAPPIDPGFRG